MFGRRIAEAIGPGIVLRESHIIRSGNQGMKNGCKYASEAFRGAGRHKQALVATDRRRGLGRTAGHVVCRLIRRRRRRQVIRHGLHRGIGGRRRHDRPGKRSQRKTGDHEDREQPAYGKVSFHRPYFSQTWDDRKFQSKNRRIQPALIRIKFLPAVWSTYLSERPITAINSDIFCRWSALLPLVIACSTQCDT